MATMIIDGATGGKQVYPYMEAASNISLTGLDDCVPCGSSASVKAFAPVKISNNEISVNPGVGYLQGRRFIVDTSEVVQISNGISGAKRYTYIVAEYNATEDGIESVVLNTVDGDANGTVAALNAQLAKGNVNAGEKYQMPLILVYKDGLDIKSVDVAYQTVSDLNAFNSSPAKFTVGTVAKLNRFQSYRIGDMTFITGEIQFKSAASGWSNIGTVSGAVPSANSVGNALNNTAPSRAPQGMLVTTSGVVNVIGSFNANDIVDFSAVYVAK